MKITFALVSIIILSTNSILPETVHKERAKLTYDQFIQLYENQISYEIGQEPEIEIQGDVSPKEIIDFLREKFSTNFRLDTVYGSGLTINMAQELILTMVTELNKKFKITFEYIAFNKRDPLYRGVEQDMLKSYEETERMLSELIPSIKDKVEKQKMMIEREGIRRSILFTKRRLSGRDRVSRLIYRVKEK
ncbi:MAG: hypothetical protein KF713_16610 [Turneriella sp.]|nr:hypothetical protein [Turneriella sp.]